MKNGTKIQTKFYDYLERFNIDVNNITSIILKCCEKGGQVKFFANIYGFTFYRKMVLKEIKAAALKPMSKVLHIGSGPLPLTSIYLAKSGFLVDAIDNDSSAIEKAIQVVKKIGLEGKIQFKEIDGTKVDCSKYDAVWISFIVYPKGEIIRKVIADLKSGGKVIYRNPRSWWLKAWYQPVETNGFSCKAIKVKQPLGKESVIITKN